MADNNACRPDPKGQTPKLTEQNAPQHKRMALGEKPDVSKAQKTRW